MHPYLTATLLGVAIAVFICGVQILCIHLASAARRRARRAEWERERPYRELRRALDDAEFARYWLHDIKKLVAQGLLTEDQAAQLSEPIQADLETAVARLDQARRHLEQIEPQPC